jgi:hypothetical protein
MKLFSGFNTTQFRKTIFQRKYFASISRGEKQAKPSQAKPTHTPIACCLLGLLLEPEYGGSYVLPNYVALQPKRLYSSYSLASTSNQTNMVYFNYRHMYGLHCKVSIHGFEHVKRVYQKKSFVPPSIATIWSCCVINLHVSSDVLTCLRTKNVYSIQW